MQKRFAGYILPKFNKISRMKNKLILLLPVILFLSISVINFSGCGDSITSSVVTPDKYKGRTEAEFNADAGAKTIPGTVVYVDLEHLNAPAGSVNGDTGPIGEDVISYVYTETAVHRIKLGADAQFKARLVSEAGEVIYQLNNPGDTARVSIPAGNYKLYLASAVNYGSGAGASQPVFIQRDYDAINSGGGAPPQGSYNKDDLNQLLTTRKCVKCNLNEVQIEDKDLTGADLTEAGFSRSFMSRVNLTNGIFFHTDWTDAGANDCNFTNAVFTRTIVNRTSFGRGDFRHAVFQRLNWDRTFFVESDMRYVTLDSGAGSGNMDGTDLSYSTVSNLDLRDMSCESTKWISSTFSNVHFYNMYFANAIMDSAKFINNSYFQQSSLRDAKFRYATFTNFRGDGSVFDNSVMTGSTMTNFSVDGASLRAVILINTIWNGANIHAVNMCHQDRTGAVFNDMHYNVDTDCWP
jgi:uncharacterized protein YjbI with pentapeptide repeats